MNGRHTPAHFLPSKELPCRRVDLSHIHFVLMLSTTDDCWYSVRIMPYRTMENVIGGVVITFIDITAIKNVGSGIKG